MADYNRGRSSQLPVRTRENFPAFFSDIDDVLGDFVRGWGFPALGLNRLNRIEQAFVPSMDVQDKDDKLVVAAELAGIEPKDVDVSIDHNVLTISGEKKQEQEIDDKQRYSFERRYGAFARSVQLPDGLDTDKAEAKFKHGVLKVCIPKTAQYQKSVKKLNIRLEDGGESGNVEANKTEQNKGAQS